MVSPTTRVQIDLVLFPEFRFTPPNGIALMPSDSIIRRLLSYTPFATSEDPTRDELEAWMGGLAHFLWCKEVAARVARCTYTRGTADTHGRVCVIFRIGSALCEKMRTLLGGIGPMADVDLGAACILPPKLLLPQRSDIEAKGFLGVGEEDGEVVFRFALSSADVRRMLQAWDVWCHTEHQAELREKIQRGKPAAQEGDGALWSPAEILEVNYTGVERSSLTALPTKQELQAWTDCLAECLQQSPRGRLWKIRDWHYAGGRVEWMTLYLVPVQDGDHFSMPVEEAAALHDELRDTAVDLIPRVRGMYGWEAGRGLLELGFRLSGGALRLAVRLWRERRTEEGKNDA